MHAPPICNAAGACDYTVCSAGWFDLDGNRANGCETAGPSTISGLRVWLDSTNAASLHHTACSRGQCVNRWDNLADPANPATSSDPNTYPVDMAGRFTDGGIMFNVSWGSGAYLPYSPADAHDQLPMNLGFMVGSAYTVYTVAIPLSGDYDPNYFIGCEASSVFDTNGAFHFGFVDRSHQRLGHYNADIDLLSGSVAPFAILLARGAFDGSHQYLADQWSDTLTWGQTMNNNNGALTHATNCAIGRGPDNGARARALIYEILIYNRALSPSESATVENYLRLRRF